MSKVLLAAILALMMVYASGCATILGGIIGHQSGEAVAGAAIGAAVDFGGGIVNAVGGMLGADKKKDTVKVCSELGYIRIAGSITKSKNLTKQLHKKFEEVSWQWSETAGESSDKEISNLIYRCRTTEGREFTLEFFSEERQDLRIYIKPAEESKELRSMLTSQIGIWTSDIIG